MHRDDTLSMFRPTIPVLYGRLLLIFALAVAARPAWGQENPAGEASSPEAVELYRSAAQLQNTGLYELAVDEWSALLEKHPQDPLARRARHNRGICLFQLGRFADAADDFQAALRPGGEFEQLESTLVNLGLAYFNQAQQGDADADKLLAEALATFDRQLEQFPQGTHAPLARFYRAEALYAAGRADDAARGYHSFLDEHAAHELAPRALYGLAVVQEEQRAFAAAEETLRRFLADHPRHEFTPEIQMRLGEALFAQQKYAEAGPFFVSAAASDVFEHADYAMLRQAAAAFEQGAYIDAARLYAALGERFPRSSHVDTARLNEGKSWLRGGESERAAAAFRRLASRGGEAAAEAAHWLSRALLEAGKPAEAFAAADAALGGSPAEEWQIELLIDKADAAYELDGRREEALEIYASVAERFGSHPRAAWARYSAADVALALGRLDAAREHARELLRAHPESEHAAGAGYVLAEAARLAGDHAAAADGFRSLVDAHPRHGDHELWLNRLALVHLAAEGDQAVVQTLREAVDAYASPQLKSEAEYLLGTAYLRLGEHDNAIRFLTRALQAAGDAAYRDAARLNLARAQHGAGAVVEAVATLERLIGESGQSVYLPEAVYRLGLFQASAGDDRAAIGQFERLVRQWPQSPLVPHALFAAATSYRALGDPAEARRALDRLLQQYDGHETADAARLLRASVLREMGDPAAALSDLARLQNDTPSGERRPDVLYLQGLCHAALKQFDAAIDSFAELLQEHPNYGERDHVYYELAWAYKDAGREEDARAAFAELVKQFPDSELAGEAAFRVAESHYEAKDYVSAAKAYAATVATNPSGDIREKALHKEGWAYFQADDFENAARRFRAQLEAFPGGELALDAQVMLAECLFQRDQYADALAEFEKVLPAVGASQSLQIIALLHAGQAAGQQREWDKALDLLQECAERFGDSAYRHEVRYEIGWAKYHLGRPDEASQDFAAVAEEHTGVLGVRAQFMQGEIAMGKEEYEDAVRIFYRVAFGHGFPDAPKEYHPWQSAAMFDAARCLEQLGKRDAARKLYQDLLDRFPEQDQAEHARKRLEELGS
jgi:cellulose synthase operon protein C